MGYEPKVQLNEIITKVIEYFRDPRVLTYNRGSLPTYENACFRALSSARVDVAASPAAGLQLSIRDGRVTLDAQDVTVRQILTEWARIGKTQILNVERITGGPITLKLENIPEKQALEIDSARGAGIHGACLARHLSPTRRFTIAFWSCRRRQRSPPLGRSRRRDSRACNLAQLTQLRPSAARTHRPARCPSRPNLPEQADDPAIAAAAAAGLVPVPAPTPMQPSAISGTAGAARRLHSRRQRKRRRERSPRRRIRLRAGNGHDVAPTFTPPPATGADRTHRSRVRVRHNRIDKLAVAIQFNRSSSIRSSIVSSRRR